ncbi:MAG: hypothetical protein QOD75_2000 [Blastocatellia bacterium]|nr:hypothetical protein [Blastocatellia bacterium]
MKTYIKLIVIGLALALLAIFLFGFASPVVALQLYALLLAYTACLYAGAALSDGRASWLGVEVGVSAVIFGCAFLGLWQSSRWLALGYVLHGLWDLCHHPRRIRTRVVDWFPPICATFDFAVAIFISVWY